MDTYTGRLVADGNGNLLADEGPRKGDPVAFDEGQYIFVGPGEPSHNERHHQRFAAFEGTIDESMTDDPSLVNATADENAHHFGPVEDDSHFDPDAENNTRLRQLPDNQAAKLSGHTDGYTGGA